MHEQLKSSNLEPTDTVHVQGNALVEEASQSGQEFTEIELGTKSESPAPHKHKRQLDEVQLAVSRLLKYAVEQSNVYIKDDFLRMVVPLLRNPGAQFTEQEEIYLWCAYNELSNLVYPVTVDSLAIAEEMRRSGIALTGERAEGDVDREVTTTIEKCRRELRHTLLATFSLVIVFFFIQGYAIFVGEAVKIIKEVEIEYDNITQRITDLRSVNPGIANRDSTMQRLLLEKELVEDRLWGLQRFPLLFAPSKCKQDQHSEGSLKFLPTLNCLNTVARFNLLEMSTHILPFILGFVGAMAAMVRQSLDNLANKSFTGGWSGRIGLRLVLGGLLGEISGVIFAPSLNELEALKLSLVFVAFLMGYSNDLAFALFDRAIAAARNTIKPPPKSSERFHKPAADGSQAKGS